jgi:hypothetical protein
LVFHFKAKKMLKLPLLWLIKQVSSNVVMFSFFVLHITECLFCFVCFVFLIACIDRRRSSQRRGLCTMVDYRRTERYITRTIAFNL